MKTIFRTTDEIIKNEKECPLPLQIIPNYLGINLCSVKGISWTKQKDGQLTKIIIHFLPAKKEKP